MSNLMGVEGEVALLNRNVRDYVIIDMTDDVTMTDAQAQTPVKLIINAVAGKTLTFPSSSDSLMPRTQVIFLATGCDYINVEMQSGGQSGIVYSGYGTSTYSEFIAVPAFGIFMFGEEYAKQAAQSYPRIAVVTENYNVVNSDEGALISMNNAAVRSFTFAAADVANMRQGASGKLRMQGAGVVTIAASGGATVSGKTTLAINDIVTWYRDGSTTNIIVG